MSEYIDRAALKEGLAPYEENDFSQQMDVILAIVDAQPTADVVEVRHGRWIVSEMNLGYCDIIQKEYIAKKYTCSECGYETGDQANKFACCPICMARMDKEADREAG